MSDEPEGEGVTVRVVDKSGTVLDAYKATLLPSEPGTIRFSVWAGDWKQRNPHGTCIDVRGFSQSEPVWVCGDQCPTEGHLPSCAERLDEEGCTC